MTVGERIRILRRERGMSAEYVADKLGVSPATVYRYENGDIEKVPGSIIISLSYIFAVTPEYLLGYTEEQLAEFDAVLSSSELRLVSTYRELNEEGKEKLMGYADDLVQTGKYIKNDQNEVDSEAL